MDFEKTSCIEFVHLRRELILIAVSPESYYFMIYARFSSVLTLRVR